MRTLDLDWEALSARLGTPALVRKVLENLLHHHQETPEELLQLAMEQDLPELTRLAHQLRGAAQYLSAQRTETAAKTLEEDLKSTGKIDPTKVSALHDALRGLLRITQQKIAELR